MAWPGRRRTTSTRQASTGTPSGTQWPYPQRQLPPMGGIYDIEPESEPGYSLRRGYKERLPPLPPWAEETVYQGISGIRDLLGTTPGPSPYEQRGLASVGGLLDPQPPGGRAFAGIAEAISPWVTAERERGRANYAESLARMGMHRSGAGQALLGKYDAETPMALGAMLAPFAMQGEQLGQQGQLAGIANLLGYGAQDYERYWRPYQELQGLLGTIHSAAPSPRYGGSSGGASQWVSAIGNLLGGYGQAGGRL